MGDISQLPEEIIHHVLSLFDGTTEEAGRVSIFCKTWYNAWLTVPTLSFNLRNRAYSFNDTNREKDANFIDITLLRYQEQKISIKGLKLHLGSDFRSSNFNPRVNKWIKIAVQKGVKRLDLKGFNSEYDVTGCFEDNSLRELSLHEYIGQKFKEQVIGKVILFNHLQTLNLFSVYRLNNNEFQGLISSCPLIENLCVEYCEGLKRIKVPTLYNLKKVRVFNYGSDVEIEAPNLQFLSCRNVRSLRVYRSEKLKYLTLDGDIDFSSTHLNNWEEKFPQIENIYLLKFKGHRRIEISSHSLKRVRIHSEDLRDVNINAPNLVSLEFDKFMVFPDLMVTNTQNLSVLKLSTHYRCTLDTIHFCMLKQLLAKGCQCKLRLPLDLTFVDVGKIPTLPTVEVDELEFWFDTKSSTFELYSNFFEALFRTCHPKAIIVNINRDQLAILFKILMIERTHETKSLFHELKEVKLEIYDYGKDKWQASDRKSLENAPEYWNRIMFRLTWESSICIVKEFSQVLVI